MSDGAEFGPGSVELPAAFRRNKTLAALYARLTGRGKPHQLALVAGVGKLLNTANTVVQRGTTWRETQTVV
jgi:transposase